MKRAIFFDLDGTLWDALDVLIESWNQAMINNNFKYRFDYLKMKSYMGLTPEETAPLAFEDQPLSEGMKLFDICLKEEISYLAKNPGKLYPDEEEVLDLLSKKYPLYVVSNADQGYIENYLNACHMDKYFKGHLCAGDTKLAKWQNILYLKEKEGIDEVIYVGDTLKDMNESNMAGVPFIHASYGFGVIENTQYKISNLKELPEVISKIFND